MVELAAAGALARAVTTDNCANRVAALKRSVQTENGAVPDVDAEAPAALDDRDPAARPARRTMQSVSGLPLLGARCYDHTGQLPLSDLVVNDQIARRWFASLKIHSRFLLRVRVRKELRARGLTMCYPQFQDAKWVANIALSHFLTENRDHIEAVRGMLAEEVRVQEERRRAMASRREVAFVAKSSAIPEPYDSALDSLDATLDPLRMFVNATQGDSITLPTVRVERRRLLRKWEEMGNSGDQHTRYLAERLSLRFRDTAAGLDPRSEAAFILTPAGHAEYHAYVISWDKGELWREANMGTEEQAAAARFAEVHRLSAVSSSATPGECCEGLQRPRSEPPSTPICAMRTRGPWGRRRRSAGVGVRLAAAAVPGIWPFWRRC
jgi:hypothetical protein